MKCPAVVEDGEIAVQIPVGLLGLEDEIDHLLRRVLQLGVGQGRQGVGRGLQPLGQIRVLEDPALKAPLLEPRGDPQIADTAAGGRAGDPIPQGVVLVGQDLAGDETHTAVPEGVVDMGIGKG